MDDERGFPLSCEQDRDPLSEARRRFPLPVV